MTVYGVTLEDMFKEGAVFLVDTVDSESPVIEITHRDGDGISCAKMIKETLAEAGCFEYVAATGQLNKKQVATYVPTKDNDIPVGMFESICANIEGIVGSTVFFTDLRKGNSTMKLRMLKDKCPNLRLMFIDHHEKEWSIIKKEGDCSVIIPYDENNPVSGMLVELGTDQLKPFVEVYYKGYSTPASFLCYRVIERAYSDIANDLLPWAAIGIISDHAHKEPNWTPQNDAIINEASKICPIKTIKEVADVLQLVGYSEKGMWPTILGAVMNASTPEEVILCNNKHSKELMALYEPLNKELLSLFEQAVVSASTTLPDKYLIFNAPDETKVSVTLVNRLADEFPNSVVAVSHKISSGAYVYIRKGDGKINMNSLFEFCKRETGSDILTYGSGPVGKIECLDPSKLPSVVNNIKDYCRRVDK